MKSVAGKLLMALFFTILTLAICELALRVAGLKFSGSTYTADPMLGWSLRPGSSAWEVDEGHAWTQINSHGFRDRERSLSKPAGAFRIAVIGDSYTEARQVPMENTFTALAEQQLNRRPCSNSRTYEVLNFGVPGYGTAQELLLLRERVWKYAPDLIVLQFYTGNDIFNNHRQLNISSADKAPYFLIRDGRLQLDESFRRGRGFDPFFIRLRGFGADMINNSVLLQLFYKASRVAAQREEIDNLDAAPGAIPPEYQRYLAYLPPSIPPMIEAWRITERLISEFESETRKHRIPLLLMIVPTSHQILPTRKERDEYRAKFRIESLEYADDRIESIARSLAIPVVRPTAGLIEEAERRRAYVTGFSNTKPGDGHFNEIGHQVIAREMIGSVCRIIGAGPPLDSSHRVWNHAFSSAGAERSPAQGGVAKW